MERIKVLIVDDHTLVRDGLKALLAKVKCIQVISVAANGLEAIEKVKESHPDVVLMDISMPGMSGLDAMVEINKISDKPKVILLSMELCEDSISVGFKNGMKGFLPKDLKKERLVEAIKRVHLGEVYFDPRVSDILLEGAQKATFKRRVSEHFKHRKGKMALELIAILALEVLAGMLLGFIGI